MEFIDFHVDTLSRLFYLEGGEEDLWRNTGHLDLERLLAAGYTAQLFACYVNLDRPPREGSHYQDVLGMIDLFHRQMARDETRVGYAGSWRDHAENKEQGRFSGFLSLEEGGVLEGRPERLDELYEKGIRAINLTWNYPNCLAWPHTDPDFQDRGLTPFGIEALERMDALGIVADVSHLSDGGFADVCRYGKRPILASHSNARALRNHSRNLTDPMIRQVAEKGGLIGVNFYADFLSDDPVSRTSDILGHLRHLINVGGETAVGLGTDFDGIEGELELQGVQDLPELARAMERGGFSSREIERVCWRNAEDFFRRYWGE